MFENLAKAIGLGASVAFLLALTHESIFMFTLGIDMRVIPYEVGDIVSLSALMLPSILGFLIAIVVFSVLIEGRLSRRMHLVVLVSTLCLFISGYYGQILLIFLVAAALFSFLKFPMAPEAVLSRLIENTPLILVLSVWLTITHAFADAVRAIVSDKHSKVMVESLPNQVSLIRAMTKGFVVRDSDGQFHYVEAAEVRTFALTGN
jgi:hypothetical protein